MRLAGVPPRAHPGAARAHPLTNSKPIPSTMPLTTPTREALARLTVGHDHSPALNLAAHEVVDRLVDLVKRVCLRPQLDLAQCRELHQLEQLDVVPDQVPDHLDLAEDHFDGRDAHPPAVANDVVAAALSEHRRALVRGAVLTDEVDDRIDAAAVTQLLHPLDDVLVGLHELVRSQVSR